jgi:hypothetical protein
MDWNKITSPAFCLAKMYSVATSLEKPEYYISGAMSGCEAHNYPAFDAIAAELRGKRITYFNPATNDPSCPRWSLMVIDVLRVMQCEKVLVHGRWWKSFGASLEVCVGLETDKRIVKYPEFEDITDFLREQRLLCFDLDNLEEEVCRKG